MTSTAPHKLVVTLRFDDDNSARMWASMIATAVQNYLTEIHTKAGIANPRPSWHTVFLGTPHSAVWRKELDYLVSATQDVLGK